jgi:hypothetical protein
MRRGFKTETKKILIRNTQLTDLLQKKEDEKNLRNYPEVGTKSLCSLPIGFVRLLSSNVLQSCLLPLVPGNSYEEPVLFVCVNCN